MHLQTLALSLILVGVSAPAVAQQLIKDFNTTPISAADSDATPVATLGSGDVLVVAMVPQFGEELWVTDGTAAGTQLLSDINPGYQGSDPAEFVSLPSGDVLFVATTPSSGRELWRTDGTAAGTVLVKDVLPGASGSGPAELTAVGSFVAFFADDGVHGIEPWRTDGTAGGTTMIADVNVTGGISNGTARIATLSATEFVFTALFQQWRMFKSDGTAGGTTFVKTFAQTGNGPSDFCELGGKVVFEANTLTITGTSRWVSDGTFAGTVPLGLPGIGANQVAGGLAYFCSGPSYNQLWRTDGTIGGTYSVTTISSGSPGSARPDFLGAVGNLVVFTAHDGSGSIFDRKLFASDGTAAGTVNIGSPSTSNYYGSNTASLVAGQLYFEAVDNGLYGVWCSDGTVAGTKFIDNGRGQSFLAASNAIVFGGTDYSAGYELLVTDGSAAGTGVLVDLNNNTGATAPAATLRFPATFRDQVVISADDGVSGEELWLTDGTVAGTHRITDIGPGATGIDVRHVASTDAFLFFSVNQPAPSDPWISDGTLAGLQQLPMSAQYPGFVTGSATAFGDKVVFTAYTTAESGEPWISDGTLAGTHAIANLEPGAATSGQAFYYHWNGRMFFIHYTDANGWEPWTTDGTASGTYQLQETSPGSAGNGQFVAQGVGDLVFFLGPDTQHQLWVTDGTSAGTLRLSLPGYASSGPRFLTPVGDRLAYVRVVGTGTQLAVSDGTLAGTQDLPLTNVTLLAPIDGEIALVIIDDGVSSTAWTTDGTAAGTQMMGPMSISGSGGSSYRPAWNPSDDKLVLEVDDPVVGRELFVTDGTVAGTHLLFDLAPEHANPGGVMRVGQQVVFVGSDGIHGTELHAFDLSLLEDEAVSVIGTGCPGTGAVVPQLAIDGEADASNPAGFDLVVSDTLPATPVVLAFASAVGAQPFSGCTLWTAGAGIFAFGASDLTGSATFAVSTQPALFGQQFVAQAFPIDPAGPILGLASATAGLEFVIGP